MQLIDIGANLAHDSFDEDRERVIAEAAQAGVSHIIVTGSSLESNEQAAMLAATYPQLFATAGIHPHHASEYDDATHARLAEQLRVEGVVAAGECGLDYFRNFSTPADQQVAFTRQLELAVDAKLPVFLHQRDAHQDFLNILEPQLPNLSRAVAHCFTGSREELLDYVSLDLYVGITGWICDERRGRHLWDSVGEIPLERLLIETDAPYLLPRTLKPRPKTRRNEPKWLPAVLATIAEARGEDVITLAKATSENAKRFFALPAA